MDSSADSDAPASDAPRICSPGTHRCVGAASSDLEHCAGDGTTWGGLEACRSGATCDAIAGRCAICAPSWTTGGSFLRPVVDHTATLLGDGRVLVGAGDHSHLYDPSSNTATEIVTAPVMHSATATRVPSGKVIFAGGSGSGFLAGTDLLQVFAPASGFSAGTNMPDARWHHVAAAVGTRVMVAGGRKSDLRDPAADTWLYDPATNTWDTTSAPMGSGREFATATVLADGRVLVAGGASASGLVAAAEVFDPATKTWTATGAMVHARQGHQAILMKDGRVFVIGGDQDPEIFSPSSNTWGPAGVAFAGKGFAIERLQNGEILIAGGAIGAASDVVTAQMYDPTTSLLVSLPAMAKPRSYATATVLSSGRTLVAGGLSAGSTAASTELLSAFELGSPCAP